MDFNFSQKLRERIINYFSQNNNISITHEQADEYLNSMADLYMCLIKITKGKRSAGAPPHAPMARG
jgi:hypothetical protein